MNSPFIRGLAWYRYKRLEEEFIEATRYFPFEERFENIWSEFFSDLLTKVGNSIDGFFRIMLDDVRFDSYSHVTALKNSSKRKDIHYFRDFFDPIYRLSDVEVKTAFGLTSYGTCCPYQGFLDVQNNKKPKWWDAYNHVKHGWYVNIEEATLKNTIESLAGLFVLNILHKESQEYLIKYQDTITGAFLSSIGESQMLRILNASMIGIPKSWRHNIWIAKTPLFMHTFRVDQSVTA